MKETDPGQRLAALMTGFSKTHAIFVVAELGIPDLIAGGETSLAGLATATGTDPPALGRLMRLLVSLGLFLDDGDGHYGLTDMGELLGSDVEGSRRAQARLTALFAPAWAEIMHSVRTSGSGFTKAWGKPLFEYLAENPGQGEIFDTVMQEVHGPETPAILAATDFRDTACLADIGGGNGSFLIDILGHCPDLRGILFDLPAVAGRARPAVAEAGLGDRCTVTGGSFFEAVPTGADAFILRHIIHDWDDRDAVRILGNVRRALPAGGRLLVVEMIVPEDSQPSPAKEFDISMLVLVGGMERTEAEYGELFREAGLELTGVTPTTTPVSIIEGRAA